MISWFEKHYKISWAITILIAIGIFYMSTLPSESIPKQASNLNSILYHIIAFFFFALFLSISLIKGKNKRFILLSITFAIFYGILDEIHQLFVQGRSCSLSDVFLDTVGISFASLIYLILIEYKNFKKTKRLITRH